MKKLYDKFVYNGIHSNDMHVLSVTFNGDLNEDFMAERTINETRTRENQTPYFQDIQHNPLEFELELFLGYDSEIDDISNIPSTDDEIRAIRVWLNQETYKPFYFEDAEDEIYMCMPVSNTEINYNHIKQGYIKLRMRCNTYYKTTPSFQTYIYDCTNNENGTEIELENHGDLDCQPDIWIKKIGDGGVSIINTNNKGQTLEFTKPENANGKLTFNGSLYDEELIKIGDKVYEVDTGDGIINSHIQRWESEMLYLEGIYVNVNGVIYKCIKSNTDKEFTPSNWEIVNESNIKVDCSLDSKQSKANLVFNNETIEDGETITIGDINYEFDLDDVYNASNGNIPIDIKKYTSKATGVLQCKSNDDFANSEIQISDKKYKILPTSTTSQIVIDDELTSWDRFQLDYDWNDSSKLNKICLLMNQKRDNTLNGIRLPYLNEEKNKNAQNNIYELYSISKLTDVPILGTADTGKFEPTLSAINNQQAGDKLTLFKRDARDITLDCGCSTKTKFVVAKAKNESTLAQGGIYNKNLRASEGDIILLAKKVDTGVSSSKVTYNGKEYSKGQFELLRISAVEETNNGSLFASHEDGTLAYTLESPSSLFEQNTKFIHGNGKTVYGNSVDLENGRKYLQKYNYRFVNTERMKKEQQEQVISSGDILLGAITSAGGVVIDPSGTTRLGGKDRYETAEKIRQYALGIESQYSSYNYKFNIILFKKQDKQITLLNGVNNFTQPYQIKQGSTLEETCLNIEKAINETGVDWVNYSAGTFKNDDVDAKYNQSTNEIILTATEYGADSNEFTTVVNDWNFSQKELSKGKLVNQFTNKTLTGGINPTWNSVYNGVKLINVVKDVLNKEQGTDFNFSISTNKINIANRKYGTIGNLISVISNCNACEFKNASGEFTVTLDGGQDPSIETCINKLVEVITTNNTDVNVEKDLTKKEIKITYKESGAKGNIPVDSTCLNAYWDCNKKLSGGENGLVDNEEICIFQETGEVISDTNRNVIDSFNFEELTLKYGVNRLIVKGNCYLQFNIRYKLL